ncbi:(2Fe-2S)-binding protein [Micromonospora carbonacea]|uniref:2Fe-2S iron-sulfur cluster binding domain-containing protein n=1 Tax=Micromonospora carbonacea TaxID=47853 RepID=A0A1C5AU27_9ACTN|nr:(2Fe-2S)-binding protein [Micromonospora carbonacea]SCF48663.1 2Fe-2S iron-sulfur cluster binding domain-containing protein [Micromonospora carbonacea]
MTPAPPPTVSVLLDREPTDVPAGVSIAAAVALAGRRALRTSRPSGELRAVFCGMGSCHECVVTVDGVRGVRACITPVAPGMRIDTDQGVVR